MTPVVRDVPMGFPTTLGPWDSFLETFLEKDVEKPPVVDRISMFFHIVNGYSRVNTYGYLWTDDHLQDR